MDQPVEERLKEWLEAGLVTRAQVDRILAFEGWGEPGGVRRRRLFSVLAIALGGAMVGAGVLLFVAANWQHLSPAIRFMAVLAMVAGFHLGGALTAGRWPGFATALHGLGTLALGAGIFLAGQIFNLQEHWPGGLMLWSLGTWLGYALLRDWVQGALAALLTPAWILGEWSEATRFLYLEREAIAVMAAAAVLLAATYLTARLPGRDSLLRKALVWIGQMLLAPAVVVLILGLERSFNFHRPGATVMTLGDPVFLAGWTVALGAPLALAALLRGRDAWMNAVATLWVLALVHLAAGWGPRWGIHGLCALGAVGLILWGLREASAERVNLGVGGFAVTLVVFYFSSIMDKLGRSLGLMVLGLLFLAGGWQLERLRRRLNALIGKGRK